MSLPFRPDIEGLRGVAVLSVFAVHSVPHALGGGFIGVDVFFVLSGWLIASITLAEVDAGTFSARAFYGRRVRRLLPALLVVLAACLAFALLVAFPSDARGIGRHVAAGATFSSNLLLWTEGGYFDHAAARKPLLHLWSLGIEEQFYIAWPLVLLVLARRPRTHGLAAVCALVLLSFTLNVSMVEAKPKGTFFLPPTRFWELGIGVALAWALHGRRVPLPRPEWLSAAGVALLVAALLLIDKTRHFPGWWAALPAAGTALLIAAGPGAWFNRRVLGHAVLRFYGRISYPLYLWHWPLLTLPLLMDEPLRPVLHVTLLMACVALAVLTHHGVERPLARRQAAPWLLAGLVALATAGVALQAADGLPQRWAAAVRPIAEMEVRTDYAAYRVERCFLRSEQRPDAFAPECTAGQAAQVLLWGDSHAAALYPGLRALMPAQAISQFTAAACPPGLDAAQPDAPHCRAVNDDVQSRIAALAPHTVVLAAHWQRVSGADAADLVRGTVRRLHAAGVARVLVVGPYPRWPVAPPRLLLKAWADEGRLPETGTAAIDAQALALDDTLRATAESAGARYVSALAALCDVQGCALALRDGSGWQAVAFDETHLTSAGSRRLAQAVLAAATAPPPRP